MAQKIELDDILKRQKELAKEIDKIQNLNEGEKIINESKRLQQKAEELRAMALVYEQQELARRGGGGPTPTTIVKVELTEEQRKRVQAETGVRMDVVELGEGQDVMATGMPIENPGIIEAKAIQKARQMRLAEENEKQNKAQAMAAAEELAKQNNPELAKLLAEKLKDPNFAGGLLYKK